jgi:cob(I)alamin adenosyltransferase
MLYTRKGDGGMSGLFGTKERLPKNSPVYDALGALDELNSLLGFCYAVSRREEFAMSLYIATLVRTIQQRLFIAQAEVAGAKKSITKAQVEELEDAIDWLEERIENPHAFVVPGATELSALFDYARAVSRRAERAAGARSAVSAETRAYLNRLSSLLYALARYAAAGAGVKESSPAY